MLMYVPPHIAFHRAAPNSLWQTTVLVQHEELSALPSLVTAGSLTILLCSVPALGTTATDRPCCLARLQTFPYLAAHSLFLWDCNLMLNFHFGCKQFPNCSRVRESISVAQDSKLFQATQNVHFACVLFCQACF